MVLFINLALGLAEVLLVRVFVGSLVFCGVELGLGLGKPLGFLEFEERLVVNLVEVLALLLELSRFLEEDLINLLCVQILD